MIGFPEGLASAGTINYEEWRPSHNRIWDKGFALFVEDITAVFDGFKALDIPALGVLHNELRVIVGPNGAGKTTLCDVISGMTRPTTGQVFFDSQNITQWTEPTIARAGVGRKFQVPNVYDSLTVYENMLMALPGGQGVWSSLWKRETASERDQIHSILERVRLLDVLETEARYLSHGRRQWLAISSLILANPKLLLVDEPAAGLADSETELTAQLLTELKEDHTLIVIEHDMDFVRRLDSRVTVLNEGRVMAEGPMEDVQKNEQVIEAYLGR